MGRGRARWDGFTGTGGRVGWWLLGAVLASVLAALGGCAQILGIEPLEERSRDAGPADAAGGTGGEGDGGSAGAPDGGSAGAPGGSAPLYWSRGFGDADGEQANDVLEDSAGGVILAGEYEGDLAFDAEHLEGSGGGSNAFLTKLDEHGQTVWAHDFFGSAEHIARAVAIDDQDEVILTGYYAGDLTIGSNTLQATGASVDIFVAKLNSDGAHRWSHSYGGLSYDHAFDVAVDTNSGEIVLAGRFWGSLEMGNSLVSVGGSDALVAKLNGAGEAQWAKQFGNDLSQSASAVAVANDGSIFVTGELRGTATFGPDEVTSVQERDIFLAKLDSSGAGQWGLGFGSTANEEPNAIAVDSHGNVLICGYFFGAVDFGGGNLIPVGQADVFIAKFDPSGEHLWSHRFGGGATEVCYSLAVDSDDSVLAAGRFEGQVSFGGDDLDCGGTGAIFLVRFAANGAHEESTCFGEAGTHIPAGLAVTSTHGVLLAGSLGVRADFGHGPLISAGGRDVLVAKLESIATPQ